MHLPRPHPEIQVASVIALDDFRAENGATRVVPGSHRWPRARKPEEHEIADAVMPAGGAVIYLGSTIHGAGANSTREEWRRGLHISYVLGWLRTEENNYLAVPPEVARTLPRAAAGGARLRGARRDRERGRLSRHGRPARSGGADARRQALSRMA